VREVHVLRQLMDANPGYGLLLVPESREFLDLGLVVVRGSLHHEMAAHTSANRRQTRIERFVGGEMTVQAVHLEGIDVNGVPKMDRLHRTVPFR